MIVAIYSPVGSKGLSKLLSILIGLVVVIVAGIALTNSLYQYVYPISVRPAVMIEYVDLVEAGDNDILILNLKNTGNVPVDVQRVAIEGAGNADCKIAGSGSPGSTFSIICSGDIVSGYGGSVSGILRIGFMDGSSMALVFRAGRGQAAIIGTTTDTTTKTETTTETITETPIGDFDVYFNPDRVVTKPGLSKLSNLKIISRDYEGMITLSVESCPSSWICNLSSDSVYLSRDVEASATLVFSVPSNAEAENDTVIVSARDSLGRIKIVSLTVMIQDFRIDVVENIVTGKVGEKAQVGVKIISLNRYSGTITLDSSDNVGYRKFSKNPVTVNGQEEEVIFEFIITGPPNEEKTVTITGVDGDVMRFDTFRVIPTKGD
jgi:hypothetical protein